MTKKEIILSVQSVVHLLVEPAAEVLRHQVAVEAVQVDTAQTVVSNIPQELSSATAVVTKYDNLESIFN